MDIRNLYPEFFCGDDKYLPYENETEYWKDLFSCLDMLLTAGMYRKQRIQEDGTALSGDGTEGADACSPEAVKSAAGSAKMHIKNRLLHTPDARSFRFSFLTAGMELSEWECFLFLLSFAVSYDDKYESVFSFLQGDAGRKLPTLRLAVWLYRMGGSLPEEMVAGAVQKAGSLFRYYLDTSMPEGTEPLSFTMSLNARVCSFLFGRNEISGELRQLSELHCFDTPLEPLFLRQERREELVLCLTQLLGNPADGGNVVQMYGPDGIGKKFLLKSAVKEQGMNLLFVDAGKLLMGTLGELRLLFHKIMLESFLLGAIVCFTGYESQDVMGRAEDAKQPPRGLRFLLEEIRREYMIAIWISVEKADYLLNQGLHVLFFELPALSAAEREKTWQEYSKGIELDRDVDLRSCANQYILTPRGIREVLWDAGIRAGKDRIGREGIRDAVGRQEGNRFGGMAARIRSIYTWDDLVIGERQRKEMEMICHHMKYRGVVGNQWGFYRKTSYGRGICAMFYGEPGTGKTMAAQVIANELGLELYRIDLSQIVSKYIGETQKNITELFCRAEKTNALLFFDEADALFAKRSEVKDFHDRNANAETAHLLQKIEDYDGITVLATNFINNVDEAFKRRIKFIVNFEFPMGDARLLLWKKIMPEQLPMEEEIDVPFFAERFELSGSSIKEVLTNAAFRAASQGRGLRNEDIAEAVRINFEKYGKTLTGEDFEYLTE